MKKVLRISVIAAMTGACLFTTGCGLTSAEVMEVIAPEPTEVPGSDLLLLPEEKVDTSPLTYTYNDMDGVFSPFYAETDGDQQVVDLTQIGLLAPEGSNSPSEISRSSNEDGSVTVKIRLRDGILCSDGTELNADDLLFNYYVLLDEDYDGPYTLNTLPIRGLSSYWNGMDSDLYSKYMQKYADVYNDGYYDEELQTALKAAQDAARTKGYSEESLANDPDVQAAQEALDQYDSEAADLIRTTLETYWKNDAQEIIDFTTENYSGSISLRTSYTTEQLLSDPNIQVVYAMLDRSVATLEEDGSLTSASGKTWNLQDEFPAAEDLYNEMYAAYNGDVEQYWMIEGYSRTSLLDRAQKDVVRQWASQDENWSGDINSVSGIEKLDDYTISIQLEYCDEDVLKTLCDIKIAPLHVYGDTELFAAEKDSFGFTKGDLSAVRANNAEAVGAGEYVYDRTDVRTIYFNANENYWLGCPENATVILSHSV